MALTKNILKLINEKNDKIHIKINIASILSIKCPSVIDLASMYKDKDSSALKVNAKLIVKAIILSIKYNPHKNIERIEIFLKSFLSFKKGGRKYKYAIMLNAYKFNDCVIKSSFFPYPNIGNNFAKEKSFIDIERSKTIDNTAKGITTKFVPYIALSPILLAIIIGIKPNYSKK